MLKTNYKCRSQKAYLKNPIGNYFIYKLPFSQNAALSLPFVFISYGQLAFLSICKIFHSEQGCRVGARDVKQQQKKVARPRERHGANGCHQWSHLEVVTLC